mgnify:CR=1 FL=1
MTAPLTPGARSRGLFAALLLAGALACAAFTALGGWQLRRLAWKADLIGRVESHLHAAPVTAPFCGVVMFSQPPAKPAITRRRVRVRAVRFM